MSPRRINAGLWPQIARSATLVVAAALSLSTAGCKAKGGAGETTQRLVLTGSSTVAPLAMEIAKRFESTHPGVRIDVQMGGSSRGVADARQGLADIGMASRALKANEQDLIAFPIARDGITVIVHADNRVAGLSDAQVVSIYTGQITNWSAVGGEDAPITVVNKAEGHSTLELFLHHFHLRNTDVRAHVVIGDNEQGIRTVSGNPHAIGYVSIGAAAYDSAHGVPIKLLPLGGAIPSIENVRAGRFPLARPLNLLTRGPPGGLARQFIDFARSARVNDLVEQQYFVPLSAGSSPGGS